MRETFEKLKSNWSRIKSLTTNSGATSVSHRLLVTLLLFLLIKKSVCETSLTIINRKKSIYAHNSLKERKTCLSHLYYVAKRGCRAFMGAYSGVFSGLVRLLERYGGRTNAVWAAKVWIKRIGSHSNNSIGLGRVSVEEVVIILLGPLKHIGVLVRTAHEGTRNKTKRRLLLYMCLTSLWSTEQLLEHIKSSAAQPLKGSEDQKQHVGLGCWSQRNTGNVMLESGRTQYSRNVEPDSHLYPVTAVSYLGKRNLSWIVALKACNSTPLYYTILSKNTRKNPFQISTHEAEKLYPYRIHITHFLHEKEQLLKCINPKTNGWTATCWVLRLYSFTCLLVRGESSSESSNSSQTW